MRTSLGPVSAGRRGGGAFAAACAMMLLAWVAPAAAVAGPGYTTRVNVTSSGAQTTPQNREDYRTGSVSGDGRYVAFDTDALAFGVPPVDWWTGRVMRRDSVAKTTTLVSVSNAGEPGDGLFPTISGDGRYVAFLSGSKLTSDAPSGGWEPVYVRDILAGVTELASIDPSGSVFDSQIYEPAISADGRHVVFMVDRSGPDDVMTVYMRDLDAGTTSRVTSSSCGPVFGPSISADGRYVAFESYATDVVPGDTNDACDVFRWDRESGSTVRVSVAGDGSQAPDGGAGTSISDDGSRVAFCSGPGNLVPGDTNDEFDVFVRDLGAGTTVRVSVANDGSQLFSETGWGSSSPAISGDGAHVSFTSYASGLVAGWSPGYDQQTFLRDLVRGTTVLASANLWGFPGNAWADDTSLDRDGSAVVFSSLASDLVPGDTNGRWDIFRRDFEATAPAPVPTGITIERSAAGVRLPAPFVLSGVLNPGYAGDLCVVEVKKPGSARWSYSSARLTYVKAGGVAWWYRYTPKLRGTYTFRVRFPATPDRLASMSRTLTVTVR